MSVVARRVRPIGGTEHPAEADRAVAPVSLAAERQRRHRQRLRAGRAVWQIEVDETRAIEALLASGAVTDEESRDRRQLERAVAEMLAEWSERALKTFA